MLTVFPNFKKIELSDIDIIESLTKQFPPYNDFEFASLWTYNTEGNNAYSMLNGNLVIKIQDFVTGDYFYSFIGANQAKDTINELLAKSKKDKFGTKLYLIPEINLKSLPSLDKYFSIREDPDSFDYILSVDEVASLRGGKYYDKRNLVNRFKRLYPKHSVELLDLAKEKTRREIIELFMLWKQKKGKNIEEVEIELKAIKKMFGLVGRLNMMGIGIYSQNKLIGFATYHIVWDNYAIMSFEKGNTIYEGIYAYINHEAAKHLKELGVKYINYEQDLGIPGLKKAKMLWRPVFFLKKYIIEEKV
jgi:uncharacterized protein